MIHRIVKVAQRALSRFPLFHRALRAVWTPPQRVYRHLYFEGVFRLDVAPGATVEIEAVGGEAENDLFWRGYGNGWEGRSLQIWRELARRSAYVADVGANTGVYALAAQAVNPSARVLAVEPSRRMYEVLVRNIARNRMAVVAVDVAASDTAGTATFYDTPASYQTGASL